MRAHLRRVRRLPRALRAEARARRLDPRRSFRGGTHRAAAWGCAARARPARAGARPPWRRWPWRRRCLLLRHARASSRDSGFTARGGGAVRRRIGARLPDAWPAKPSARETRSWRARRARVRVRERSGKRYLMIFGIDEHRHVYWYYPAWANPAEDPLVDPDRDHAGHCIELNEAIATISTATSSRFMHSSRHARSP